MTRYPKRDIEREIVKGDKPETWLDWDPRTGPDPQNMMSGTSWTEHFPHSPVFLSDREKLALERADYEPADRPDLCSEREQLLLDGASITAGPRNIEYGEPIDNLSMTGALKEVFHKHMQRHMGPAEREAIDMVLTKLGRLGRGAIKRDTYMDAAVYMAIAYEVAMIEQQKE